MSDARKINVYVVSTSGYEQRFFQVRQAIFDVIEELGMHSMGYEKSNFGTTEPKKTIVQNCINNMGYADIFLVLVNERYGFIEDEREKSVTHSEIEYVRKSKKPYILFVQDDVVDILDCLESKTKEDLDRLKDFFAREPKTTDRFLGLLKHISSDCWCAFPKDDPSATAHLVKDKIVALAPLFAKMLVEVQKQEVQHHTENSLYNIAQIKMPLLYQVKGEYRSGHLADYCVDALLKKKKSLVLEGECGAGKSFSMGESFVALADTFCKKNAYSYAPIPVFLRFRSFDKEVFDPREYLLHLFRTRLRISPPPFLMDSFLERGLLVVGDGIDEWKHAGSQTALCTVINSLGSRTLISARTSTYKRILVNLSHSFEVLSVYGWRGEDLFSYAKQLLGSEERVKRLESVLDVCEQKSAMRSKDVPKHYPPLIAGMAVHCLGNTEFSEEKIASVGALFREATLSCMKRELVRVNIPPTDQALEDAKGFLCHVAMFVILANRMGRKSDLLPDLYEYLEEMGYPLSEEDQNLWLPLFFTVHGKRFYPKHLFIAYYFAAEQAVEYLLHGKYAFFAQHSIASEVNRMMGDLYKDVSSLALEQAFEGLGAYTKTLTDDTEKMRMYYFIPRLVSGTKHLRPKVTRFLQEALPSETGLSKIAILNWLTQLGDMQAEALYLDLICNDPVFSSYNRGAYLFYQQDRPDDTRVFRDVGTDTEWQATALAFIEHFRSEELRQKCIRRPDMAIMLSFLRTGKKAYPYFISYFGSLCEEKLLSITFDERYTQLLQQQGIDVERRKQEMAELLRDLQAELARCTDPAN